MPSSSGTIWLLYLCFSRVGTSSATARSRY
ncbi:unnamed protein product [Linum tenue]|uniref:Uncharacterized protein n=1 Tax=Linum tenue TaxID=586396 RepID=A0AAV0NFA6_9ROSI|nr:unnamed protein product [Linum tenue]